MNLIFRQKFNWSYPAWCSTIMSTLTKHCSRASVTVLCDKRFNWKFVLCTTPNKYIYPSIYASLEQILGAKKSSLFFCIEKSDCFRCSLLHIYLYTTNCVACLAYRVKANLTIYLCRQWHTSMLVFHDLCQYLHLMSNMPQSSLEYVYLRFKHNSKLIYCSHINYPALLKRHLQGLFDVS